MIGSSWKPLEILLAIIIISPCISAVIKTPGSTVTTTLPRSSEPGHNAGLENGNQTTQNHSSCQPHETDEHVGINLATFRWEEIGVYFSITAFIVIAGMAKLGFHKLAWLSNKVPESCLLVILGLAVGLILYFTIDSDNSNPCQESPDFPRFSSETFFLILLPPIILDSAYSLHDRVFLDNLGTILVFAVIGTLINVFAIGASLFGIKAVGLIPGMELSLSDAFVFSSLISAVDPVAVLAIFQELCINQNLYFLVFGESLLNDGVTVVLYNTMQVFRRMTVVTVSQVLLAILSFFIASLGGILIGVFFGLLTAVITKCTHSVRVVEPLAMLTLAYLSYLTAELFHFSGIISLIVCGLVQAHYGFYNISQKSYICVKYFTKMASSTSDTVIFMFLGMVLVNDDHEWNTAFVLWSLMFCFVYRFISVFSLSAIMNRFRTKPFGVEEQFIAAYGGLRGAVAFSLASTLDEDMKERHTFIFTTLIVILFTIFVQGITIRPLVRLLNIQKHKKNRKSLSEEIAETSIDHVMAGVEEIMGHHGDFYLRELITHYNDKYLKKHLLHDDSDTKLTRLFEKIALSEHYAHLYGPVAMVEDNVKPLVRVPDNNRMSMHVPMAATPLMADGVISSESLQKYPLKKEKSLSLIDVDEPVTRKQSIKRRLSIRKSQSSITPSETPGEGQPNQILRRAFQENKYNRLHYTYNRNLNNDDEQELSDHLHRRTFNAQRMSAIASANYSRNSMDIQDLIPGSDAKSKPVSFHGLASTVILLQRHQIRSQLAREGDAASSAATAGPTNGPFNRRGSSTGPLGGKGFISPKSPTILEENEKEPNWQHERDVNKASGESWQPEVIPLLKMPPKKTDSPPPV